MEGDEGAQEAPYGTLEDSVSIRGEDQEAAMSGVEGLMMEIDAADEGSVATTADLHTDHDVQPGDGDVVEGEAGGMAVAEEDPSSLAAGGPDEAMAQELDPQAPPAKITPAKSAWMLYIHDMREVVKKERPGLKMTEQMKIISERWKALDEQAKKPYVERAAEDKKRFQREKAQQEKAASSNATGNKSGSSNRTRTGHDDGEEVGEGMEVPGRQVGDEMIFPLARARRTMKLDPEVKNVAKDAALIVAKATELFLEMLSEDAAHIMTATGKGRKTLKADDVTSGMRRKQCMSFLRPDFPLHMAKKTPTAPRPRTNAAAASNKHNVIDGNNATGDAEGNSASSAKPARPTRDITSFFTRATNS